MVGRARLSKRGGRGRLRGKGVVPVKPVICVSSRLRDGGGGRYELGRGYCEKLLDAGCVPVILPFSPREAAEELLARCDALLLSGGEDPDPALYGAQKEPACGAVCRERDDFELTLLALAERRAMPVLGICRGAQIMNVYYGGTLVQDIESRLALPAKAHSPGHYGPAHTVTVQPGTRLASIFGAGPLSVNSNHHQCVETTRLTVAARDENGVAEAIELAGERFVLGVQWHPERLDDGRLFAALAAACGKGRAR